jgi:hypothetical protein
MNVKIKRLMDAVSSLYILTGLHAMVSDGGQKEIQNY